MAPRCAMRRAELCEDRAPFAGVNRIRLRATRSGGTPPKRRRRGGGSGSKGLVSIAAAHQRDTPGGSLTIPYDDARVIGDWGLGIRAAPSANIARWERPTTR